MGVREQPRRTSGAPAVPGCAALADGAALELLRVAAQERALSRASLSIFGQTDEAAVVQEALHLACALLPVDAAALFLGSGDGSPPCRAVQRRGAVEILPPEEAPVDALATDVARRQTARQCRSWSPPGSATAERCLSALAVPLAPQGETLGVLIVGRHAPGRFRKDHVALLGALGQHVALALFRARERAVGWPADGARMSQDGELERRTTEFVSAASHEIRAPLTALQGFTELLLSRDVPPSEQRDWLSLMNQEAARRAGLVQELQELNRTGCGQPRLSLAPLDVGEVICRVARLQDGDARRVHLLLERGPRVLADGDKLTQVVTNLLRNALDYSAGGQPVEVEAAARCLAAESGSLVVVRAAPAAAGHHECRPAASVAVRDRGIGMRPEELRCVFQPFYRADASRELRPEGSGLGLAIAKAIVERHGGALWARSRVGQGSIFGFCLPGDVVPPERVS